MTALVNIIIISHNQVGNSLKSAAEGIFNAPLQQTELIDVPNNADTEKLFDQLINLCDQQKQGSEILVLTDLFGATPCNLATRLRNSYTQHPIRVVAGLNLSMLLRIMNYRELPLDKLAEKALSGAQEGVVDCERECC